MSSSMTRVSTGKFTGNGSDRKIVLGEKPKKVEIYNVTDGVDYAKSELMDTDKARKESASGDKTYPSAVSLQSDGFTLLAAENVADKEFHYVAYLSRYER